MASMSRSFDLTWSNWGLIKKTQRQTHRKPWDWVGPALLMRYLGDPLHLQAHLFKQHMWESGVKARWVFMGPVVYAAGTAQLWYVVIYCTLSWLRQHALFSLQDILAELCLPLAGSGSISHVAFWQSCAHAWSISTASVSLLARQPCWTLLTSFVPGPCLSAQRSLTRSYTCHSSFSVYLVTGLP
jgi:hypothetical protein